MAARDTTANPLSRYWAKRDFAVTSEPRGRRARPGKALSFVIQKHAASRLHYDFRLELDGILVSWAVPKGPSYDPADKRMAIHVEDHPLSYGSFEGTIPPKQYGAGTVIVWDHGTWEPVGDPHEGLAKGKLVFRLHGQKMEGLWELVKIAKGGEKQEPWLLFKKRDEFARAKADYDVVSALPDSVIAKPLRTAAPPATAPRTKVKTGAPTPSSKKSAEARTVVPGAKKAPMPATISPQLATLASGIPADGEWVYEIKFDGYRVMARIQGGKASLITRGGHDWSAKMPRLVQELGRLGLKSAWLDGEIVVLTEQGLPSFNALQKAFDRGAGSDAIVLFLFDVPYFEGYDLREVALGARRQLLKALLDERATEHVRYSADFESDPSSILTSACQMNLEGVIAKRLDAPYVSRRSETWLKLKCKQRQEFVVCGYTDRTDGSPQIGSLLLGVHGPNGELVSVGSVGTGWDATEAQDIKRKLAKLEVPQPPFAAGASKPGRWSKRVAGSERWVKPVTVAEVEFAEWTPEGQIRHASYVALRTDKPASAIVRETAKQMGPGPSKPARKAATGSVKVSNAERVIDPSTGLTKLDLVRYYESVAEWMLPHLQGRPCSLVRGPSGIQGELFFQKHDDKLSIPGVKALDEKLWPGHARLLEVGTAQALANAAQMNVIEFHTWNSLARNIDKPDRMIFDLDPGEGTTWPHVQEAAALVRTLLSELGLESWLKTSGGKGLHVVVPLAPRLGYDTVRAFSQAIVQHLARAIPSRFVAKSGPSNRVGKLFVDYLRNGHGATTAAAFSARARPGLGVSVPVSWNDLATLKSGAQWTIATAREHLSFQATDPWEGYWKAKQTLTGPMKVLGFTKKV
ncbi:bifunctional non-homologous end joining protein LigD [Variovorax paradoxus]|uniref:DNA ligase (ATP) n=1 Tax=Variovorax paradoxus TaxID=34073 RepID=A0AAW8EQ90_VARPD|nr:DNA ligase D [Variovorax paradoxus]MDP9975228.1 bifunctional non-homologous end joining protein LigD [Variovorax paradoxus]